MSVLPLYLAIALVYHSFTPGQSVFARSRGQLFYMQEQVPVTLVFSLCGGYNITMVIIFHNYCHSAQSGCIIWDEQNMSTTQVITTQTLG